jgi:sec-independent protein translocase protein TatB
MFDIGFIELLLIAVVALLVLGPERLPGAVREVALWVGRVRRHASALRRELEREIDADGIRRDLHNERIMADLKEGRGLIEEVQRDLQKDIDADLRRDAASGIERGDAPAEPPASDKTSS